jgi:hypothetical protein
MTKWTFCLLSVSYNNTKYRICLENCNFHTSACLWSPWDIFIVQRIGKRHFDFDSKRQTMKGNILPKLPAQLYFYLEQDKYTEKLI